MVTIGETRWPEYEWMGVDCLVRKRSRGGIECISASLQKTEIGDLVVTGCPLSKEASI